MFAPSYIKARADTVNNTSREKIYISNLLDQSTTRSQTQFFERTSFRRSPRDPSLEAEVNGSTSDVNQTMPIVVLAANWLSTAGVSAYADDADGGAIQADEDVEVIDGDAQEFE
jgi:hypothetical protein